MARGVIAKLEREPALFDIAHRNIERWRSHLVPWPPVLQEWEAILDQDGERATQCLTEDLLRGRRLRQSHPFVGVLTPKERNAICRRHESISA